MRTALILIATLLLGMAGTAANTRAVAASLTGAGLGSLSSINLTTVGSSDWAHWPEYSEKLSGASQISNYVLVGGGTASSYGNATLTLGWSDGNRPVSGSATTGSFVPGIGKGFQISVPASTTSRQLTVYVGGYQSVGKLTAHLSDGSAADFADSSYSSSTGIYQANYTLTYQAASAGQTLTVTWTTLSGSGNVVLDGAALAGGGGGSVPATATGVTATQGTSVSGVTLGWTAVSGATSYTIYRSTAAGTQGPALATVSTAVYIDTSAVAGTTYFYSIVANNAFGSSAVSAPVSGYVASAGSAGSLSGARLGNLSSVNLTTVGTSDWAHWPEYNEKLTGASQISNYLLVGGGAASTYGNANLTLRWSDGNRTASASATTGSYVPGIGKGFQISVPASTTSRQLTVYVGGYQSVGKLTAHLSDGSAADFTDSSYSSSTGIYQANYTLTYQAASAGQVLTVNWTMLSGSGNVVLDGAALAGGSGGSPPPPTLAPVPVGLAATAASGSVSLTWSASSGATSYNVQRATQHGGPYTNIASPTSPGFADSAITNGTTYYYVVSAVNATGSSANSAEVSATPAAAAPALPAVPAGLAATPGSGLVTVTWNASSGATSYNVQRATQHGGPYTNIASPTSPAYADATVTNGTAYYYVVSAVNATGSSASSVEVAATPAAGTGIPPVPTGGPPGSGYTLIFDDEFTSFNGNANGTNSWKTQYNFGRSNNAPLEAEYYSDSSVGTNPFSIVNGTLQISATTAASTGANALGLPYNSGIITSFNSFHMEYGYFEISAKMPLGAGLWPAFWLLPEGGGWPPEIDVMEQVGSPTTIYQSLHYVSGGNAQSIISVHVADTTAGYHTYAVDWEPTTITIYFDGQPTTSWSTPSDMHQAMYLLLNLAVGGPGSWPGPPNSSTVFPANMNIDYVRAYTSPNSVNIGGALAQ